MNAIIQRLLLPVLLLIILLPARGLAASNPQGALAELVGEKDTTKDTEKTRAQQVAPDFLSSPAATVRTFMEAMAASPPRYGRAIGCFALENTSANNAGNKIRAERLYGYLRNLGYGTTDDNGLPRTMDEGVDTFALLPAPSDSDLVTQRRSTQFEELSNGRARLSLSRWTGEENPSWLFDGATLSDQNLQVLRETNLKLIDVDPELRATVGGDSFEGWLLVRIPPSLRSEFLFIMYWQWIGMGFLIFLGLLGDRVGRLLFRSFIQQWTRKTLQITSLESADKALTRCVRAFGLLLSTVIWHLGISLLFLPLDVLQILLTATNLMLILAAVNAGFKLTDLLGILFVERASKTENKLDDLLVPLLTKSAKILLVILGFIYFAQAIDVKISPLLAGLGIGGIGFAFAAQNSIENFFGSVTVLLDRPFQVGDWVVIDDVEGTVVAVGMRSSRVRTFYDSVVTLPNSILVNNKVNNYGMRSYRRWTTRVGLLYETTPEQVEAFCEGARELVREHPYMRKDYYQVFLNEFGDSGIEVLVYVFWQAPDWQTELRERHRYMLDLMRLAKELNVSFAYPTQTVYLARSPGIEGNPPELEPGQHKAENERRGREAARKVTSGASWRKERPAPYQFLSESEARALDAGEAVPNSSTTDAETRGSEGE